MIITKTPELIQPYGGRLVDLLQDTPELREQAGRLPSLQISQRAACDLELLAVGAFSPLERFMGQADYQRVLHEMRLADGHLFPIPVTLPVHEPPAGLGDRIALRSETNDLLAIMTIEETYPWDRHQLARQVVGSSDPRHPLVSELERWGRYNLSGPLQVLGQPRHADFRELRLTPAQVRQELSSRGRSQVVAFQTRNPLHRAHEELTKRALEAIDGTLLLHPVVGMTKPGDVDHCTRVRTYRALVNNHYHPERIVLALLPLAMRMAGPREALWHALIRRNYGANHLIVGRDHASPGQDSSGRPFYGPYEAQELVEQHSAELGVGVSRFQELVYLPDEDRYEETHRVAPGAVTASLSGTQVREEFLSHGRPLPEWFTRREVADILAHSYPPRHRQGACLWFTGLSCSGKSTTAQDLALALMERGRPVTVLDGDVVRTHLSRGLTFSREDRDTNVLRIAFVAAEIVRHGGLVICAAISPYRAARNDARSLVGSDRFIEVFVDTPVEVCEQRDSKGLYGQARRGQLAHFTGVSDPYEPPEDPELVLETVEATSQQNTERILAYLVQRGLVLAA